MDLLPADWVLCAFALAMAVLGLFRGFSGTLAFFVAIAVASGAGMALWNYLERYLSADWQRGAATLVAALLVFGLARIAVKKSVNVLLAQPTDALVGMVFGAVFGVAPVFIWAKTGMWLEYSRLALEVSRYVG